MGSCKKSTVKATSPFTCLLFDLDDTLYSSKVGIRGVCKKNIEEFLVNKCGISDRDASALRVKHFKDYGSTLAGLRAEGKDINADEYHEFVHGSLPYENLEVDPQLREMLLSIKQKKLVFTNSDRRHAKKVLKRLQIEDCFDDIICFETLNPNVSESNELPIVLKPSSNAIKIAIKVAREDPAQTLFLDDNNLNIEAGSSLGLRTVLVGKGVKSVKVDYVVENILDIKQIIPEIWVGDSLPTIDESGNRPDARGLD